MWKYFRKYVYGIRFSLDSFVKPLKAENYGSIMRCSLCRLFVGDLCLEHIIHMITSAFVYTLCFLWLLLCMLRYINATSWVASKCSAGILDNTTREREIESIDEKDKRTNGGNVKMDCYCTHYCSHRNSIYSVRASKAFLEVAHSTHTHIILLFIQSHWTVWQLLVSYSCKYI